jgi:hypothetical protein
MRARYRLPPIGGRTDRPYRCSTGAHVAAGFPRSRAGAERPQERRPAGVENMPAWSALRDFFASVA